MTPTEFQGVTIAVFSSVGLLSAGVWAMLFFGRRETGTLLPYAPRAPVRWGPLGLAVAVFFVSTTIAAALGPDTKPPPLDDFLVQIWGYSLISLTLIGLSQLWLRSVRGVPIGDLGWPSDREKWKNDFKLGIVAAIAAVGPVYAIQIGLINGLGLNTEHELIDAFQREPRLDVALAVCFSAVVAAPIFEELLFRQLTQGWLERLEEKSVGWREPAVVRVVEEFIDGQSIARESIESRSESSPPDLLLPESSPPKRSLAGLPYGWFPIAISSLLFALAHVGQGANPISLFFLALGLGYLYQRTHRIVPCMIAHMLFNAFGMVQVGLSVLVETPS